MNDFIYLLNIYASGIRAKKSKIAFKSGGVPRRNLSAAYSALTSFYSTERAANCGADDLWFEKCFRTKKPLALHWTGTGLLYFFFLFSAFHYKKKILHFGKQLRVLELLVSSPAASASCLCQQLSGNTSLFLGKLYQFLLSQWPIQTLPRGCVPMAEHIKLPFLNSEDAPSASFIAHYQPLRNGIVCQGKPHDFPQTFHP